MKQINIYFYLIYNVFMRALLFNSGKGARGARAQFLAGLQPQRKAIEFHNKTNIQLTCQTTVTRNAVDKLIIAI